MGGGMNSPRGLSTSNVTDARAITREKTMQCICYHFIIFNCSGAGNVAPFRIATGGSVLPRKGFKGFTVNRGSAEVISYSLGFASASRMMRATTSVSMTAWWYWTALTTLFVNSSFLCPTRRLFSVAALTASWPYLLRLVEALHSEGILNLPDKTSVLQIGFCPVRQDE